VGPGGDLKKRCQLLDGPQTLSLNSGSKLKSLAWAAKARRRSAALGPADLGAAEAGGATQSLTVTGTDAAVALAAAR
jgi:hypothetical protein